MPCLSWSATRWSGRACRIYNRPAELALILTLERCPKRWRSAALVICSPPSKPAGSGATVAAHIWGPSVRSLYLHRLLPWAVRVPRNSNTVPSSSRCRKAVLYTRDETWLVHSLARPAPAARSRTHNSSVGTFIVRFQSGNLPITLVQRLPTDRSAVGALHQVVTASTTA